MTAKSPESGTPRTDKFEHALYMCDSCLITEPTFEDMLSFCRTLEAELSTSLQARHTLECENLELRGKLVEAQGRERALVEAIADAHAHVSELRDAFQTGALSCHDGLTARRSNRNVEIEVRLRALLRDGRDSG